MTARCSMTSSFPHDASAWHPSPSPACTLERLIGQARDAWTPDDLVRVASTHGLRLVSLLHVGGDGWLKTLDFVPRDMSHLHEVLRFGERADGSSLFGPLGIPPSASDVVLRPRIETAFIDPFARVPTLAVLCAHHGRDGRPLPESPDTLVRAADDRLRETAGIELHALGEIEFFLGKQAETSDVYGARERGYHATAPFVFGEAMRRDVLVVLAEMGIPLKYGHSEVGYIEAEDEDPTIWEQHEIEMALLPLPQAADAVVLAQWVLRNLAHQRGWHCSFEPVVRRGHAGSGMHFHLSPHVDGLPVAVSDGQDGLEPVAAALVGGLVLHAPALMAFGNREPSSFVRLSQAKEAPSVVTWGRYNRKALVRLPIVARDENGRLVGPETVEFRLPDGSAHPHLLLAGVAQAAAEGARVGDLEALLRETRAPVAGETRPGATVAADRPAAATTQPAPAGAPSGVATAVHEPLRLPRTFAEVASELTRTRATFEAGGVFPPHVIDRLVEALARRD